MIKTNIRAGNSENFVKTLPSSSSHLEAARTADRFHLNGLVTVEEDYVVDDRSGLSPAQSVENRLSRLLKETSVAVSHLQTRGMLRAR